MHFKTIPQCCKCMQDTPTLYERKQQFINRCLFLYLISVLENKVTLFLSRYSDFQRLDHFCVWCTMAQPEYLIFFIFNWTLHNRKCGISCSNNTGIDVKVSRNRRKLCHRKGNYPYYLHKKMKHGKKKLRNHCTNIVITVTDSKWMQLPVWKHERLSFIHMVFK